MEAIAAIDQRLSEIQTLIASLAPAPPHPLARCPGVSASGPRIVLNPVPGRHVISPMSLARSRPALTGTSLAAAASQLNANGVPRSPRRLRKRQDSCDSLAPITAQANACGRPQRSISTTCSPTPRRPGCRSQVTDGTAATTTRCASPKRRACTRKAGSPPSPAPASTAGDSPSTSVSMPPSQAWMRQHAKDYGFVENVPREPWHWEFAPTAAARSQSRAVAGLAPDRETLVRDHHRDAALAVALNGQLPVDAARRTERPLRTSGGSVSRGA